MTYIKLRYTRNLRDTAPAVAALNATLMVEADQNPLILLHEKGQVKDVTTEDTAIAYEYLGMPRHLFTSGTSTGSITLRRIFLLIAGSMTDQM